MNSLELDIAFEQIWSFWLNKVGENAARKALKVTMAQGTLFKDVLKACRVYYLDHQGDDVEFTKKLNNFLMQDDWKDVLEYSNLEKLEKKQKEGYALIDEWNKACKKHWCPVLDREDRVVIAKRALDNEFFKNNYNKALDKCAKIFQYSFRDSDTRSKVNINFRWFTTVGEKHTVLDIMEGKFGRPQSEIDETKYVKVKKITDEERKNAIRDFREVFGDIGTDVAEKSAESDIPEFD